MAAARRRPRIARGGAMAASDAYRPIATRRLNDGAQRGTFQLSKADRRSEHTRRPARDAGKISRAARERHRDPPQSERKTPSPCLRSMDDDLSSWARSTKPLETARNVGENGRLPERAARCCGDPNVGHHRRNRGPPSAARRGRGGALRCPPPAARLRFAHVDARGRHRLLSCSAATVNPRARVCPFDKPSSWSRAAGTTRRCPRRGTVQDHIRVLRRHENVVVGEPRRVERCVVAEDTPPLFLREDVRHAPGCPELVGHARKLAETRRGGGRFWFSA
jgi:hypothetical protein